MQQDWDGLMAYAGGAALLYAAVWSILIVIDHYTKTPRH